MTTQKLFDFVTDPCFADDEVDDCLDAIHRRIANRPVERTNQEQVDEAVFMSTFIPRSLGEVLHSEREQLAYQQGTMEKALVTPISRLEVDQRAAVPPSCVQGTRIMDLLNEEDDQELDSSDEDSSNDDDDNGNSDNGSTDHSDDDERGSDGDENDSDDDEYDRDDKSVRCEKVPLTDDQRAAYRQQNREEREKQKELAKLNKKARKQETKEEKKVRRQTKIPKDVKKRHKKLSHQKNKT